MAGLTFAFKTKEKNDKEGVCSSYNVTTVSIGKHNQFESPYCIANEYIASSIGHYLRLPIPPCAITRKTPVSRPMFTCMRYLSLDSSPPDADALPLWELHPLLVTGITLFDILICNPDRNDSNVLMDNNAGQSASALSIMNDHCLERFRGTAEKLFALLLNYPASTV